MSTNSHSHSHSPSRRLLAIGATVAVGSLLPLWVAARGSAEDRASTLPPAVSIPRVMMSSAPYETSQFVLATKVLFRSSRMNFDNIGPAAAGASPFVANGLRVIVGANPGRDFALPEKVTNAGPVSLHSYINGLVLNDADASWQGDGVDVTLAFTSKSAELMPAFWNSYNTGYVPDADYGLDPVNVKVKVHVVPVTDGIGRISFTVSGVPVYSAQPVPCVYFPQNGGTNICPTLEAQYNGVQDIIEKAVASVLSDATTRSQGAAYYDSFVPSAAAGKFTKVTVSGGKISLWW